MQTLIRRSWVQSKWLIPLCVGLVAAARLWIGTTLGLTDDEAWYWALAQRLEWSYFVHPPLSVWLLRATQNVLGMTVLGVRLSPILCSALGTLFLMKTAQELTSYSKAATGFTAILLASTAPLLFFGGLLAGPDLPLFTAWSAMLWLSFRLAHDHKKPKAWEWALLGLAGGLGMLAKFTGILALFVAVIFPLVLGPHSWSRVGFSPPFKHNLRWALICLAIAFLLATPVLYWNAHHAWGSFQFQFIDRHRSTTVQFGRWGVFWLSQLILFGPGLVIGWFLLVIPALFHLRGTSDTDRCLAWWAFFPGLIFFIQPLFSAFKIHWALSAYLPVILYLSIYQHRWIWLIRTHLAFTVLVTAVGLSAFYRPLGPTVALALFRQAIEPKQDVTNDVYGWQDLVHHLRSKSFNGPYVTSHYQTAAQLAFALGSKEQVQLIPQDSWELLDWAGPTSPPNSFFYVSDLRYRKNPNELFQSHHCSEVTRLDVMRGSFVAKNFLMERCETQIGGAGP